MFKAVSEITFPNTFTAPESGCKYPAIIFIRVVFHPPLAPTSAVFFHSLSVSEKLSKTGVVLYEYEIFSSTISEADFLNFFPVSYHEIIGALSIAFQKLSISENSLVKFLKKSTLSIKNVSKRIISAIIRVKSVRVYVS